tara:strand:+ start:770 stop:1120 length:351 start_codon:yes stop_codon:yes gene_type:complete
MLPMFIFWPAGSLLAIRSPWNDNVMVGGIAWAFIIVLGVMGVRWMNEGVYQPIMLFHVPGILLTIVTQVQWAAYKKQMADADDALEDEVEEPEDSFRPRPSARRRRRSPRNPKSRN